MNGDGVCTSSIIVRFYEKVPLVLPVPDSQLVDILKMAEDKMEELQLALDSVRKEKRELQESVKELKRQVRFKIINNDHLIVHH